MESTVWKYDGILSLSSPYLVRKLQSKFGIDFPDEPAHQNGTHENGLTNGHNTHASGEPIYNLRSRKVLATDNAEEKSEDKPEADKMADIQESVGTGKQKFIIRNKFYHNLFLFGAALGNELFYCALWSNLIWHLDFFVMRAVCLVWCLTIYFGQALKELIAWPRPSWNLMTLFLIGSSPPAAHLEARYELEYGMPSTHAVVGVTVPYAILYFTWERYQLEPISAVLFFTLWCLLTCTSRTYLGMHSVLDVLAGMVLGALLFVPAVFVVRYLDQLFIRHVYGAEMVTALMFIMCFTYPALKQWNTSRADTYMTCAVTLGVFLGGRFNYLLGHYVQSEEILPRVMSVPSTYTILYILAQTLIGSILLGLTRQVCKTIVTRFLCFVFGLDRHNPESLQCKRFELPYKFLVYVPMCVVVSMYCPLLFARMGLSPRPIAHFEYIWP